MDIKIQKKQEIQIKKKTSACHVTQVSQSGIVWGRTSV